MTSAFNVKGYGLWLGLRMHPHWSGVLSLPLIDQVRLLVVSNSSVWVRDGLEEKSAS